MRSVGVKRVIAIDLTRSEIGIPVVRIVTPGLEWDCTHPDYVPALARARLASTTNVGVVFSGPSLPPAKAPVHAGFEWRPPVRQGDVYRAAQSLPALIGIIDGYFESVATVWHKEILWAMTQGIHVYGAASIGALRAAELADFGMRGVGTIFHQFYTGALADDEEVALLHGPKEVEYVQVTEAMVNVRATVARALQLEVIPQPVATTLLGIAKSLFYKDRTYEAMLSAATAQCISQDALSRFAGWLPNGKIDQKRLDALAMIAAMTEHAATVFRHSKRPIKWLTPLHGNMRAGAPRPHLRLTSSGSLRRWGLRRELGRGEDYRHDGRAAAVVDCRTAAGLSKTVSRP